MSPRRARAVKHRPEEDPSIALCELLIETAEDLLAEHPISTITTRDIARAADVSDGVLYNYFANKDELLITALVRRVRRDLDRFEANLPQPGSATVEENLNRFIGALFDLHAAVLPHAGALLADLPLLHRLLAAIHQPPNGMQRYREQLTAYLVAEQRLGRVATIEVDAAATLLSGAAALLAVSGQVRGDVVSEAHQLPSLVETLVRGLAPEGRRSSA